MTMLHRAVTWPRRARTEHAFSNASGSSGSMKNAVISAGDTKILPNVVAPFIRRLKNDGRFRYNSIRPLDIPFQYALSRNHFFVSLEGSI